MTHLTYAPASVGGWTVLASTPRLLALTTAPDAARLTDLLDALAAESGFQGALDLLTREGISASPEFLLVEVLAARTRIVVRGDLDVHYTDPVGDHRITGADVSTWAERSVSGLATLRVDAPAAVPALLDTHLPLVSGAAYASSISLAVVSSHARAAAVVVSATVDGTVSEATVTDVLPATADATVRGESVDPTPAAGYEYLFGDTVFHSVSDAAVRPDVDDDPEGVSPKVGSAIVGSAKTGTATTGTATTRTTAASAATAGVGDEAAASESTLAAGDHDGHTVVTSHIAALRAAQSKNGSVGGAASGMHAGAGIPSETPAFTLEFGNGARESVGQSVILGRAPSATKISGARIPRLIVVGGADQDISRSHAQFVVEGDTVVITDLHSRNGTLVTLPGKGTRKLRAGEPTAVIVGTLIDFGGGITMIIGRE